MKPRHVVLLIAGVAILLAAQLNSDTGSGSSYSFMPGGTRALYLLLEQQGVSVEPFLEPFTELNLEQSDKTLVSIAPDSFGGAKKLAAWVRAGNKAVLFAPGKRKALASELSFPEVTTGKLWDVEPDKPLRVTCAPQFAECRNVGNISKSITGRYESLPAGWETALTDEHGAALLIRNKLGRGEIWLMPDSSLTWNQNLDRFDNLTLVYQLLGSKNAVLFDEFHHGYVKPTDKHLAMKRDAVIVLIAFVLLVLTYGALSRAMRFGPALHTPEADPSSSVEFATVSWTAVPRAAPALIAAPLSRCLESPGGVAVRSSSNPAARCRFGGAAPAAIVTDDEVAALRISIAQLESPDSRLSEQELEAARRTLESVLGH